MPKLGLSSFLFLLVLLYIGYSVTSFYHIFYPAPCPVEDFCLYPAFSNEDEFVLSLYGSARPVLTDDVTFLWSKKGIRLNESFQSDLNISLPLSVRQNGSYHLYVFLRTERDTVQSQVPITAHRIPIRTAFNLLTGDESVESAKKHNLPVTHWRSEVTINVLSDPIVFNREEMPPELIPLTRLSNERGGRRYLPMLYCNPMLFREKDLVPVNTSSKRVQLHLHFQPLSVGKLRLWTSLEKSTESMRAMGFQQKDIEEMRGIFADTNFYFLMITVTIAAFHLLFDFLAFKNDISFWRNTSSTAGLSARTVTWRSFSSVIILLYLIEENTSLLVLVPSSIGALIEFWKLSRVWKVRLGGGRLLKFETRSSEERATESFDSQALRYLSIPLLPLCIGAAIYSLIYVPHKSWYSWTINSLANCVYAFGFLFMTPQLFINYKLKSVAHLPWKALTYKAFNTFIDDFFAFIITMPTSHRLACFRDDIVFLIYVYQRWLYPVDKSRAAEGAQYFGEEVQEEAKKKK